MSAAGEALRVRQSRAISGALLIGSALSLACASPSSTLPPPAEPALAAPSTPSGPVSPPGPAAAPLPLEELEKLTTAAELEPHVRDRRVEARRIIAKRLANLGGSGSEPLLATLANDRDLLVTAYAITGLAALADASAQKTVASTLGRRSATEQDELLVVMRDQLGGTGLLALTLGLPRPPEQRWNRQKAIFDALDQLHDPRAADSLVRFVASRPHPHYAFRAAAELAQLGDPRAVPYLAERLRKNPLTLYSSNTDWEAALKRDDNERVSAARSIADLAAIHPDRVENFRGEAESALLFWATDMPSPHANAMRALAALGSKNTLPELGAWAFPSAPLPKEGQQPPMLEEWVIAESAQRYLGQLREKGSFTALLGSLKARPPRVDVSMGGLLTGNVALLGMSLRALAMGAAEGLSEWGDPKAFPTLLAHARDPMNNEDSRLEACLALAWVARERDTQRLIDEVYRANKDTAADHFRRVCLLEGLARRATHVEGPLLLALLEAHVSDNERSAAARGIARAGIDAQFEQALLLRAQYELAGNDAVLALVLAGSPEAVALSLGRHVQRVIEARMRIAQGIKLALEYLSQEDVDRGFLFNVIRNADAAKTAGHVWVESAVAKALARVVYDNGPHSLTRPVLRYRLYQMAQSKRATERQRAMRALWYFRERGTLLALGNSANPDAAFARAQAELLFEPLAPCEECPSD